MQQANYLWRTSRVARFIHTRVGPAAVVALSAFCATIVHVVRVRPVLVALVQMMGHQLIIIAHIRAFGRHTHPLNGLWCRRRACRGGCCALASASARVNTMALILSPSLELHSRVSANARPNTFTLQCMHFAHGQTKIDILSHSTLLTKCLCVVLVCVCACGNVRVHVRGRVCMCM